MRKILCILFAFILLLNLINPVTTFADEELDINGTAALLMDYDSNTILYEKNIHKQLYPASTTKVITGILAIENSNLDDIVTIDEEVIELTYGSHIALDYDEEMSVNDLLHALLIASANDAALALAKNVSGSIDEFVDMMNEKTKELGGLDTNFINPNGLHEDEHKSSAHDLALIGKYAMENDIFREIVAKDQYTIKTTNKKDEEREIHSTNRFLYGNEKMEIDGKTIPIRYEGLSGVKTGYTPEAKSCLISFVEKDNRRLLTVVLNSEGKNVYSDTTKLLDYGFDNLKSKYIGHANEFVDNINIENGEFPFVPAILDKNVSHFITDEDMKNLVKNIHLKKDLKAPIEQGESLGTLEYYLKDEIVAKGNIVATMSVKAKVQTSFLQTIKKRWYIVLILFLIFIRILIGINNRRRLRKKRKTLNYSPNIK